VSERRHWDEPDRPFWYDDADDHWRQGSEFSERDYYSGSREENIVPAAWPVAIAAGLSAGGWWLRRGLGPCPPLAAFLLGLAVMLAARAAGPLAEDGLIVAESAAQLSGLARLARTAARKLAA
jgi:hypothetical protein